MNHDFHIGDKVVYPNHGVGIVEQISSRTIGSMVQKYYELHIKASNLRVTIPFSNVAAVGLRRVIKSADIEQILEILINSKCENHADWKPLAIDMNSPMTKLPTMNPFIISEIFPRVW